MATVKQFEIAAKEESTTEYIRVRGARVHNLKNIDCEIPHNALTVITGVSGSGKSSLAFDTLYAEGQRRYVESLSAYARQFLERMEKPDADEITGIAPAVAIQQRNTTRTPRSTVATATEIYDYLRLLFARAGQTFCAQCGAEVKKDSVDEVADRLLRLPAESGRPDGLRAYVLFPLLREDSGSAGVPSTSSGQAPAGSESPGNRGATVERLKTRLFELRKLGFNRLYQDGQIFEFSTPESLLEIQFHRPVWVLADRLTLEAESRQRLIDSIELCYREGGEAVIEFPELTPQEHRTKGVQVPRSALERPPRDDSSREPFRLRFNERFECKRCRLRYEEPEPRLFLFNSPYGACPRCQGFGNTVDYDPRLVIPDPTRSLDEGAIDPWTKPRYRRFYHEFKREASARGIRLDVPYAQLTQEEKDFIWQGTSGGRRARRVGIQGFFDYLNRKKYKLHVRVFLSRYRGYAQCPDCRGGRLRPEAYRVLVGGHDIRAVCQMSIEQARKFFDAIQLTYTQAAIADCILEEVRQRLRFLENVGLEYLTLDRLASTLSGGEAQRIQLATALGASLVGALYVLDEPSIGLHSRDTARLIRILEELRDQGNTILVVEHDATMMKASDHILDLGPGAGENGGRVQFAGSYTELVGSSGTLTGRYLRGDLRIPLPEQRRKPTRKQLKIHGAFTHNLKNIDVAIPLGMIVAVTGVSGSGKSTLVHDVLYQALRNRSTEAPVTDGREQAGREAADEGEERVGTDRLGCRRVEGAEHIRSLVLVDQSPIGRTPRSNPVTYIKAFDAIRVLFAEQPEARKRGYSPGHFSFNITGGRCDACQGSGTITVEMQFLADVELVCEECSGTRFKSGVLGVRYRGKNIHDVLQMTVREALGFFGGHTTITRRLQILDDVGLVYLRLGQSATTLSGGEAQRVKLAGHLAFGDSESALYIFDEPTTGLHFDDIAKLLGAFRKLVENGGSILIIEHNLDVVKTADWVIDLGPEGGDRGGQVVCRGTPESVARCAESHTGRALRPVLEQNRADSRQRLSAALPRREQA
jgi:excinuclease ABC subunit A